MIKNERDIVMSIQHVNRLFHRLNRSKKIHESSLLIEKGSSDILYTGEYNRTIHTPILAASVTKLYTTAVIMKLHEEEKLRFDDPVTHYLSEDIIQGIHQLKGNDYTQQLTIDHLLCQTSGLPDYFFGNVLSQVLERDIELSFEVKVKLTREQDARFIPNRKHKAYYSDINFDLLGKIIENITNMSLSEVYDQYIFPPLALENTWLAEKESQQTIPHTYIKDKRIERPLFIQSCEASGGIVTITKELMIFIKAFWKGHLFDTNELLNTPVRRLQLSFFPIKYGRGYMQVVASYPFIKKRVLIGHSGSSGAFAFYCPEPDIYLTGDVAQNSLPAIPVRLAMRSILMI